MKPYASPCLCVPLQFVASVADQCLNHCDRLAAHDELASGAWSANCPYRRGEASHLYLVEAMNPTSLDDFAHQSGQTQLKFVLHALVELLAVAQMQVRLDVSNQSDLSEVDLRPHLESAKSCLRLPSRILAIHLSGAQSSEVTDQSGFQEKKSQERCHRRQRTSQFRIRRQSQLWHHCPFDQSHLSCRQDFRYLCRRSYCGFPS
jgi:hypothetical protein